MSSVENNEYSSDKNLYHGSCRALKIYEVLGREYLLVGFGSSISIYNLQSTGNGYKLVYSFNLPSYKSIHSLKIIELDQEIVLLVLAENEMFIYNVDEQNSFKYEGTLFNHYWIVDVILFHGLFVMLDATNSIYLAHYSKLETQYSIANKKIFTLFASSPSKQILYSGNIIEHGENIWVGSGTVTGKVIIWKIETIRIPYDLKQCHEDYLRIIEPIGEISIGGAVFSISLNIINDDKYYHLNISTTDDNRSLKITSVKYSKTNELNNSIHQTINEESIKQQHYYNHIGRVWRHIIIPVSNKSTSNDLLDNNIVVTVGEDGRIVVHQKNQSIKLHEQFASSNDIWAVDFNKSNDRIVIGSNDGSVLMFDLPVYSKIEPTTEIQLNKAIRNFSMFNEQIIVLATLQGELFIKNIDDSKDLKDPDMISIEKDNFKSYICMSIHFESSLIALGTINGKVFVYHPATKINVMQHDSISKICCFYWFDNQNCSSTEVKLIASCFNAEAFIYRIKYTYNYKEISMELIYKLNLTNIGIDTLSSADESRDKSYNTDKSERYLTCFINKTPNILFCGSRNGLIYSFKLENNFHVQPFQILTTTKNDKISSLSVSMEYSCLATCSRNSTITVYNLNESNGGLSLFDNFKVPFNMEWIESVDLAYFPRLILVLGFFEQNYFGIIDVISTSIIWKINCGGGYRSWQIKTDYLHEQSKKINYTFMYRNSNRIIRNTKIFDVSDHLNNQIKSSLHSREIRCVNRSYFNISSNSNYSTDDLEYFITGSEDTSIKIWKYIPQSNDIKVMKNIQIHCSSVLSLEVFSFKSSHEPNKSSLDGDQSKLSMLLSCGGRSSMFITLINHKLINQNWIIGSYVIGGECSTNNEKRKKFMDYDPRIMCSSTASFDNPLDFEHSCKFVVFGYSNSLIRLIYFQINRTALSVKYCTIDWFVLENSCIIKSQLVVNSKNLYTKTINLIVVSSNGQLALYKKEINVEEDQQWIQLNKIRDPQLPARHSTELTPCLHSSKAHNSGIYGLETICSTCFNTPTYCSCDICDVIHAFTSGEDGNINVFNINLSQSIIYQESMNPNTHCSAVTDIKVMKIASLKNDEPPLLFVFSIGQDKRLKIWLYDHWNKILTLKNSKWISINDPQHLIIYHHPSQTYGEVKICICGVGTQLININLFSNN